MPTDYITKRKFHQHYCVKVYKHIRDHKLSNIVQRKRYDDGASYDFEAYMKRICHFARISNIKTSSAFGYICRDIFVRHHYKHLAVHLVGVSQIHPRFCDDDICKCLVSREYNSVGLWFIAGHNLSECLNPAASLQHLQSEHIRASCRSKYYNQFRVNANNCSAEQGWGYVRCHNWVMCASGEVFGNETMRVNQTNRI